MALILGLAVGLRVWGLPYGLPYFVHPDESILVPIAVQLQTGDLNPHFFNWPSLYIYTLGALYAVYGVVLSAITGVPALEDFARDPGPLYLLGRVVTATLGVISVGLTYRLGDRLFGPWIGLAAGFFLAVDLQHVADSHFATTDVPVTCAVLAAMLATTRYWERGGQRAALWAGVLGGLAAAVKYNGALVGAAFLVAHGLRGRATADGWRERLGISALCVWFGGAVIGFVAGTPFAALAPREFLHGLFAEVGAIGTVQFGNEGDLPGLLFHLLHSLPQAMGVPLLLCVAGGIVVSLWRHTAKGLMLVAFPLPYLLIIGSWSSRFERYAVPLLPFASLLAAVALAAVVAAWPARRRLSFVAAALVVATPSLASALYYAVLITRPDSREVASQWIERSIAPGSRVAMEPYAPALTWRDQAGQVYRVTSPPVRIVMQPPRLHPETRWASGLRVSPVVEYDLAGLRGRGIDYVVVSSFMYKRYAESCQAFPARCRFYRDLDANATLVYAIEPIPEDRRLWVGDIYAPVSQVFARTRPGPIIKMYRLRGAG